MSIAILGNKFNNDDNNVVTIDSGSLRQIDNITRAFKDEEALKSSEYYRDRIITLSTKNEQTAKLVLTYIKNNKEKIELDLIYDNESIRTRTSSLEDVSSEVEKSRKLLLNSKNQMFLTSFLLNKTFFPTTLATVKMTIDEYKVAKKEGYKVTAQDGEYRIPIREVLKYRLNHKKLGSMRLLVEDTLEVWKKNMLNLNDEDLYFYSRQLRLLLNEYDYRKMPRKAVINLSFNRNNIQDNLKIKKKNDFRIHSTYGLPKRKVLEERKAA